MTSLEHKLCQIEEILQMYPNGSVRVKFHGSDNYRHFPSGHVTRDTFWDTCPKGVPNDDFDVIERDTNGTLLGHLGFLEWFKINDLENRRDTTGTLLDTKCPADDLATAEPQTSPPLGGRLDAGDAPTVDWADLSERDFELALQTITTVEELSGVANRRRVLNHDFKKWSEVQKSLILSRKFILENEK